MFPLSSPQKLIYDMEQYAGGTIAVICGSALFPGDIAPERLTAAIQELFRLNEALRIRIQDEDGLPGQEVFPYEEPCIPIMRFDSAAQLHAYANGYAKEPISFFGPLCEIQAIFVPGRYGLLVKCHHIVGDAWSLTLLASQLTAILAGESPAAFPYSEYVTSEAAYLQSARREKDRSFFLEQFKQCPEVTYLSDRPGDSYSAQRATFTISADQASWLRAYAKSRDTSPFVLFLTAFATYFSRVKDNAERFYIGTPVLNRGSFREKHTAGMFINTVPILARIHYDRTFAENLAVMQETALSVFRRQKFHYNDILTAVRQEYGFTEKLYDVVLSYQNAAVSGASRGVETTWYHSGTQTESLQIHIDDRDGVGAFRLHLDYRTDKFTGSEMDRMYAHILTLLLDAVSNDTKRPSELELLSEKEKQQLLADFNATAVEYPKEKCVHQLFEEQVERTPDRTAVIACDRTLTYRELNEEANRIAHGLIEKGVEPGDIVAFALPRNSHLIPTMFGILKAGAAYLPIDPDYPQERIAYTLEDSGAKLFIAEAELSELLTDPKDHNPMLRLSSDSLCYCIYTSGSTGKPKGASVTHRNLVNFCSDVPQNNLQHYISVNCNIVLACGAIVFDIANFEIVLSLLLGKATALANEKTLFDAASLGSWVEKNRIDCIHCTPTKLNAYLQNTYFAKAFLQVKCTMVGGERLTDEVRQRIALHNHGKIFNGYGPTETTMGVCFGEDGTVIGRPIANTQIYIVDKYLSPVPIGVTGELCIAGDGVGAGYLNRPKLTAEKFIDNPFGPGKLYKTGDLAYWREDGNIVYVGRNDFQVKIRGLRIELGEIESAISGVDGVSQAVVVVRKDETGRQLICAFYTESAPVSLDVIKAAIRDKLPRYMMPHIFTRLDNLPLTPSGKVDRKALPEVDFTALQSEVEYVAPSTPEETALAAASAQVLGLDQVGMRDNFFDLGGDSLKAIELTAALERAGYSVEIKAIFAADTVGELAEKLTAAEAMVTEDIPTGDIPATPAQMRVYTAQSMSGGTAYNVPYVFKAKSVDPVRLQAAVSSLIDRHEILRTRFENRDGEIMQVVDTSVPFALERLESDDISTFVRPFDLSKAPLLRVGYFENTVMVDLHHIITDGGSMPVFLRELNELYMGRELTTRPVQYREFATQNYGSPEDETYWLGEFSDEPPVLELNTDSPRPVKQSYAGAAVYETIPAELHEQICALCRKLNVTPYVYYLGAFYILLSKFSGNEDIVVGTPASGRSGKFLDALGMFVNTLALRGKPEGQKTVQDFLTEVNAVSVNALDYQNYPYGKLVKKLGISTEGRNPLFDVMFAYQSAEMTNVVFDDAPAELLPIPVSTSKYDFTFTVMPREKDVVLMVEYCTTLLKEPTILRFMKGYTLLLSQMLESEKTIKELSAINEAEQYTLLNSFNATAAEYPKEKCVHQLFEEQVERTPDRTAVIACDRTLTYRELNEEANRIAHGLIEKGVEPGDIVAFALPRNSHLIPTMFGILKAGAAYLPIDPDYPQERIAYTLEDSGAKLFIAEAELSELLTDPKDHNPMLRLSSDSLCYCIYTSGSTGKPKGVCIRHYNLVNFCQPSASVYHDKLLLAKGSILSIFRACFDGFGGDSVLPALLGKTIALPSEKYLSQAELLAQFFLDCNCTVIQGTPSMLKVLCGIQSFASAIKHTELLLFAAEAFTVADYQYFSAITSATLINGYGPSEATIGTTFGITSPSGITIGRPIANTQIYIVDKYLSPVPIGVTGELCIAGDGVGAGYLNRPKLTAEKFIDNPFGPGKLYKTGDLAYWREDGNIVYVGRNDFQVKIRGLRIELGEIESAISGVEGVSQAVVVVRKDETGRQLICAFYTESAPVSLDVIKAAIREKLPRYMMPHIFTRLDNLPLTPSGKVDRNALPEVDLHNISLATEYVPPMGEMEKRLASLMEQVLEYSPVGRDDNFFDLGGDSLKAIEFISKAHSEGIYLALQSVFDHLTVAGLARVIREGDRPTISYADVDFTNINGILAKNRLENCAAPQETEIGNLLLAGATGFLGIHILSDFLNHDSGTAYCLVRGEDQMDSESRMAGLLRFYFGEKYIGCDRIRVLRTDLRKEHFGLTEEAYGALCSDVDTVVNAAASVKHYGSYQYFKEANVDTTERLICFCQDSGAKLLHISTLSVSGNSFDTFDSYVSEEEKHFYERDLYIGQPLDNVYARSKFEAERVVLEAMARGLRANIFRMGNLTSRLNDGVFQKNYETNAFLKRVKALLELGIIPDYLMLHYVEFTPIDEAAAAIMIIARHFRTEQTVFHINSTKVVHLEKLIEYFAALGYPIQTVSGREFSTALRETAKQTGMEHILEIFINDLDEQDRLNYDSNIRIENSFTEEYLRKLGFTWSEIGLEYLRKYVEYFKKIGYWRQQK